MGIPRNHPNMVPLSREAIGKPGNHDGEYWEYYEYPEYPRTLSVASQVRASSFFLIDPVKAAVRDQT